MVPLFYLHLCMFSFLYPFYPTPVGDNQRGKRKTSEQAVLSDSNTLSERQKKMVCFGGHSLEEDLEWSEPQIKDSGVDTCSSTTLNEEHSHIEKVLTLWCLHFNLLIWSLFSLCHSLNQTDTKKTGVMFPRCRKEKQNHNHWITLLILHLKQKEETLFRC